jgi:hypothetical protein
VFTYFNCLLCLALLCFVLLCFAYYGSSYFIYFCLLYYVFVRFAAACPVMLAPYAVVCVIIYSCAVDPVLSCAYIVSTYILHHDWASSQLTVMSTSCPSFALSYICYCLSLCSSSVVLTISYTPLCVPLSVVRLSSSSVLRKSCSVRACT